MFKFRTIAIAALPLMAGVVGSPPTSAGPAGAVSKIVFVGASDGQTDLYTANTDGTGRRNLTRSPGVDETMPSVSPDGSMVAFVRDAGGIWKMGIDGAGTTQLTTNGSDSWPSWTPDGQSILFTRRQGDFDIFRMAADGTNPVKLLENTVDDESPVLSPDGEWIVFTAVPVGVFRMHPDGSGLSELMGFSYGRTDLAWGPDSLRFAFTEFEFDGSSNIWIFDTQTFGSTQVTTDAGQETRPDWSADGLRIAFTDQVSGANTAIFEVNVDGSGRHPITPRKQGLVEGDAEYVPSA